jgi:hypothetical protein
MDSLLIHDGFECYYAGRKTGFGAKAAAKQVASPEKRDAIPRERLLPVRLSDLKTIRRFKPK